MMRPTVTVDGFKENEEDRSFTKIEYMVAYTLDWMAMSDFCYWHGRERARGTVYPTLKDFAAEYKKERREGVLIVELPADIEYPPSWEEVIQKERKQINWRFEVPALGQFYKDGKACYVCKENLIEYEGNSNMQDSIINYWGQELGRFGNTPTVKGWYDSLSILQRSVMEVSKQSLEVVM